MFVRCSSSHLSSFNQKLIISVFINADQRGDWPHNAVKFKTDVATPPPLFLFFCLCSQVVWTPTVPHMQQGLLCLDQISLLITICWAFLSSSTARCRMLHESSRQHVRQKWKRWNQCFLIRGEYQKPISSKFLRVLLFDGAMFDVFYQCLKESKLLDHYYWYENEKKIRAASNMKRTLNYALCKERPELSPSAMSQHIYFWWLMCSRQNQRSKIAVYLIRTCKSKKLVA